MKSHFLDKRIPTVLGISLIVFGVVLTSTLVKNQTSIRSRASNSEIPQNIKITNLSDNSFTITYQTDEPTTGSINYGIREELGNTELDDLDEEKGNFSPKNIHSITVKKLSAKTKYRLAITSNEKTFLDNGNSFEISTGPRISTSSSQFKVQGNVVLPDGNLPTEALVYLDTENSQLFSTLVKDGKFSFSLESLRTKGLSSYIKLSENSVLKLFVIANSLKSNVLISLNQANPIPTITLSNDYDFTTKNVASKSAEFLGFPSVSVKKVNYKPQILSPKNNQSFTNQRPQFRGTSLPNEKIEIIISSEEKIQTEIIADSNGNWTYRPPSDLSPGEHTITIRTRDSSGILTTIMQSFTVLAAESQAPTPTPTQMPTPTPTILILPPTDTPSPTVITEIPSPTPTLIISAPIEPPGTSPAFLILGGIIATFIGITLFILTYSIL